MIKRIVLATLISVLSGAAYAEMNQSLKFKKIPPEYTCGVVADYIETVGIMILSEQKQTVEEFLALIRPEVNFKDYHEFIVFRRIEIIAKNLYKTGDYNNLKNVVRDTYILCLEAHKQNGNKDISQ